MLNARAHEGTGPETCSRHSTATQWFRLPRSARPLGGPCGEYRCEVSRRTPGDDRSWVIDSSGQNLSARRVKIGRAHRTRSERRRSCSTGRFDPRSAFFHAHRPRNLPLWLARREQFALAFSAGPRHPPHEQRETRSTRVPGVHRGHCGERAHRRATHPQSSSSRPASPEASASELVPAVEAERGDE